MTESFSPAQPRARRRGWLILAACGVGFMTLAMIVVALVIADKPHFGWLVGSMFVQVITSGVILGGLMVLVAAIMLPERKTWRGIVLILWALIAVTSPLFGFLFLLPWSVLAVMLPLVIVILVRLFRG